MMWTSAINLKFTFLNAENLFLLFDRPPTIDMTNLSESQWKRLSTSVYENKDLKKIKQLAQSLKEINADIIMLCEVGGIESLKNFNELFLNGQYSPALIEGNSDRNIDVGFLIRKGLPFYFDLNSNKNRPINYLYPHERDSLEKGYQIKAQSHRFSRDVVELMLFTKDKENPFLIVLLTHLKSRLDRDRIDPGGFERRQAELKTLIEIYQELEKKYPQSPIMIAGDFNGNASATTPDEEFKALYENTKLQDVLELTTVNKEQRATFYQIRNGMIRAEGKQIDYCFLPPTLTQHLKTDSAHVYRYKDEMGLTIDTPQSIDAKLNLPSDHYPIVFELEKLKLW